MRSTGGRNSGVTGAVAGMPPISGAAREAPPPETTPRFLVGSTLRHVVIMASTGAIGLVAVFAVDLLNMFYLSLLGEGSIVAAVGFAGMLAFLQTSLLIGMTIGLSAVVARNIGAGRFEDARRITSCGLTAMVVSGMVIGLGTVAFLAPLLRGLGAGGASRDMATLFLTITSPSVPLLAAGMGCSALLRCVGDARRAMNVTLFAAVLTALVDPILIFGLHLGLTGAALTTVLSRLILAGLGLRWVACRHRLFGSIRVALIGSDLRAVAQVATPAVLTNLATPAGAAFVTHTMAGFGPAAVAGMAIIERITPVAFGLIYALTGAVGPIISQNLGGGRPDRVRDALKHSLAFVVVAVGCAWALLAAGQSLIARAFSAHGVTADLVLLYCSWTCGSFLFVGALFVGNAAFNNLGRPLLSTLFNWGRATLGTIPFVAFGAAHGAKGVLIGQAAGSVLFGIGAAFFAFRVAAHLQDSETPATGAAVALPLGGSGIAATAMWARRPRLFGPKLRDSDPGVQP